MQRNPVKHIKASVRAPQKSPTAYRKKATAPCLNSKYQQWQQCQQRQPQQAAQEPSKKQKKHGSDNKDNKDAFSRRDQHQQSKLTAAETAISDPTRNLNLPTESN
jgi:hypothetical protein